MARREGALVVLALALSACEVPGGAPADATTVAAADAGPAPRVGALGRLEPRDGILRVAGPSRPSVVIAELLVDEGDRVRADQPLAILDARAEDAARVARAQAELANALADQGRVGELYRQAIAPAALRDAARLRVDVARAELQAAEAALALDTVRAPVAGQVVAVHARAGERVESEGIVELARNDAMYAVAEVYETDIGRVRVGQHATVESPALAEPLSGRVERIGLRIGRQMVLGTDPVRQADGHVVEVRIKLDDSERAAALSALRVEVEILP
jgi:HlyD family secretion protein